MKKMNHIIGKVYDLTQENMNLFIQAYESEKKRADELEDQYKTQAYDDKREYQKLQEILHACAHVRDENAAKLAQAIKALNLIAEGHWQAVGDVYGIARNALGVINDTNID